jgi:AhpD family alkylhydroperoxidase
VLAQEVPEVSDAFFGFVDKLSSLGGLDEKTFQLVYIGIQATRGAVGSVAHHTTVAKKAGATREEIRGTILLSLMAVGVNGIVDCLVPALEAYDAAE